MTDILGPAACSPAQAEAWAESRDAAHLFLEQMLPALWSAGVRTGVRPDVLVAQAFHETGGGRFGRAVTPEHHNTAGIKVPKPGADDAADSHERFSSWRMGAEAHANHLRWPYCGESPIGNVAPRSHGTARAPWAGTVTTVEGLSTKWAPSITYHTHLIRNLREMAEMPDNPGVTIITRQAWSARLPKRRMHIPTPSSELWLHHFASEHHGPEGMRQIQSFHMDTKGWSDIAYSFCVDEDGVVYEGRGVGVAGGHTQGHNEISHAICLMGNFDTKPMPKKMVQAAARLVAHGAQLGWWPDQITGGHRQASGASTACPGRYGMAALPDINALALTYLGTAPPSTSEEDDMADEIINLHRGYYNLEPGTDKWNKNVVASFNHHLKRLLSGTPLEEIRKDFAKTVGLD